MRSSKRTRYDNLTDDIWKMIMIFVVQSPEGEKSLARARSVNKSFKKAADDVQVLQCAKFQDDYPYEYPNSFWSYNALLQKCMRLGNVAALDFTLKVITTQLILIRQKHLQREQAKEKLIEAAEEYQPANTLSRLRLGWAALVFRRRVNDVEKIRKAVAALRLMYRTSCWF